MHFVGKRHSNLWNGFYCNRVVYAFERLIFTLNTEAISAARQEAEPAKHAEVDDQIRVQEIYKTS